MSEFLVGRWGYYTEDQDQLDKLADQLRDIASENGVLDLVEFLDEEENVITGDLPVGDILLVRLSSNPETYLYVGMDDEVSVRLSDETPHLKFYLQAELAIEKHGRAEAKANGSYEPEVSKFYGDWDEDGVDQPSRADIKKLVKTLA